MPSSQVRGRKIENKTLPSIGETYERDRNGFASGSLCWKPVTGNHENARSGREGREVRQVAMIDAQGRVDAWTGKNDIQAAGHISGKNYSVQANLMLNDKVWPAMSAAFENSKGDLAERMLAALEAAQAAGGDIRGKQSAALIVVTGKPTGQAGKDRIFDLRVDDSPEPLIELRRLVRLQRAYNHMNAGDLAVEHKDHEGALREYGAAEKLAPDRLF